MALGNGSAEGGNMGGQGVNQLKPIFSRHMEPMAAYRPKIPATEKHSLRVLSFHKWQPL